MNEELRQRLGSLWIMGIMGRSNEEKLAATREALDLAQASGDLDAIFDAKLYHAGSTIVAGYADQAMPLFAWCLAHFEQDPQRFQRERDSLLRQFKRTLQKADEFPQLSLEQIEGMRTQMGEMLRQGGYSLRTLYYTKMTFGMAIGDRAAAADAYERYADLAPDDMGDCATCELNNELDYLIFQGDFEQALQVGGPILRGEQTCAQVPHYTFGYVLRPLALLGSHNEADDYQSRGYELIRSSTGFLSALPHHLAYLSHRGQYDAALQIFENHLPEALDSRQLRGKHHFYLATQLMLTRLAEERPTVTFRPPQHFPLYQPSGEYAVADLIAWLESETAPLAEQFNQRNGNQYFTHELVDRLNY
ncbi:hypothetical protein [Blastopirellula marina]|uniref:Tetratricopeptide repeat protein n=1 Tax=Blastopirellula marina TaxID=124 RepID=A0A2S8G689_9BACT|nr:hypothetical protein [Blastopirellula marina]PQO39972.1 hypothetical protein C5Y98_06540 [Blastopirellula marina]PTL45347.1 hypothetical protein C5Y97_06540 [Blastopirellula marina]